MRYAGIIKNDIAAGNKVNVTFFVQGCAFHCAGCHNPQTWDFEGGKEFTNDTLTEVLDALHANGVERNFSIMGGEPLCPENLFLTYLLASTVKKEYPNVQIYIWTGYVYEDLLKRDEDRLNKILELTDFLIDGPYI